MKLFDLCGLNDSWVGLGFRSILLRFRRSGENDPSKTKKISPKMP